MLLLDQLARHSEYRRQVCDSLAAACYSVRPNCSERVPIVELAAAKNSDDAGRLIDPMAMQSEQLWWVLDSLVTRCPVLDLVLQQYEECWKVFDFLATSCRLVDLVQQRPWELIVSSAADCSRRQTRYGHSALQQHAE